MLLWALISYKVLWSQTYYTGTNTIQDRSRVVMSSGQLLGMSMDRPLCHVQQQEMSPFRVPISGYTGSLHWCFVDPVELDGHGVCLLAIQSHPNRDNQTQTVSDSHHDLHSSVPNGCIVDAGATTAIAGHSHSRVSDTSHSNRSSNQWRGWELDLPLLKSSRLETLKALFWDI